MSVSAMNRLRSLRVIDVMNRQVIKVGAEQSMAEIAREFFDRDISAAPVVDEKGCCVGILSATDFLRRDSASDPSIVWPAREAKDHHQFAYGHECGETATEVNDVACSYMTRTVRTVNPQTLLLRAAMLMNLEHIHRLPVVDEDNHVVGMISTMDVVDAVLNSADEMGL